MNITHCRSTLRALLALTCTCLIAATAWADSSNGGKSEEPVFEIRNYHYDPAQLDAYKAWAIDDAIPFFKQHMDVVGFWMGNAHPPTVSGTKPMELALGSANITWIIRWDSMEARATFHKDVFGGEEWRDIWSKHPDPKGYFQSEARFTTAY